MKALQFIGDNRCQVNDIAVPDHRRRRGAPGQPQRRHLPQRSRTARRALHHPVRASRSSRVTNGPAEVVRVGSRGQGPARRATVSSASASSGRSTSASASAAPRPSSSWPRSRGCTASRTTCPGRREHSSSRSAAATTRPCGPTTSTRVTRRSCSGAGPIGLGVVAAAAGRGARVIVAEPTAGARQTLLAPSVPTTSSTRPPTRSSTEVDAITDGRRSVGGLRGERQAARHGDWRSTSPASGRVWSTSASTSAARRRPSWACSSPRSFRPGASSGRPGVWPQTLRFLSRSGVDLSPLVTASYPLGRGRRGDRGRADRQSPGQGPHQFRRHAVRVGSHRHASSCPPRTA